MAWFHLTNSCNSDGQWPPTLLKAPHIVHPFNYSYCFENLLKAEMLVGGVNRDELITDPVETLNEILSLQQNLVLEKAETILATGDPHEVIRARQARTLIRRSKDNSSLCANAGKVLYPSDYRIRAEMLVEARRLVGGVRIESL